MSLRPKPKQMHAAFQNSDHAPSAAKLLTVNEAVRIDVGPAVDGFVGVVRSKEDVERCSNM